MPALIKLIFLLEAKQCEINQLTIESQLILSAMRKTKQDMGSGGVGNNVDQF